MLLFYVTQKLNFVIFNNFVKLLETLGGGGKVGGGLIPLPLPPEGGGGEMFSGAVCSGVGGGCVQGAQCGGGGGVGGRVCSGGSVWGECGCFGGFSGGGGGGCFGGFSGGGGVSGGSVRGGCFQVGEGDGFRWGMGSGGGGVVCSWGVSRCGGCAQVGGGVVFRGAQWGGFRWGCSVGGAWLMGGGLKGSKGANVRGGGGELNGIFLQFELRFRNRLGRTLAVQSFRITHLINAEILAKFCMTRETKNKVKKNPF